jgi:hypothetical protein
VADQAVRLLAHRLAHHLWVSPAAAPWLLLLLLLLLHACCKKGAAAPVRVPVLSHCLLLCTVNFPCCKVQGRWLHPHHPAVTSAKPVCLGCSTAGRRSSLPARPCLLPAATP